MGLMMAAPMLFSEIRKNMLMTWSGFSAVPMTETALYRLALDQISGVLLFLGPMIGFLSFIVVAVSIGQQGWIWSTEPLAPDWSRINPITGIGKLFSFQAAGELFKTLLKFIAIGGVTFLVIRRTLPVISVAIGAEPAEIWKIASQSIRRLTLESGIFIGLLGGADYLFQWWMVGRSLRMSRQEVKEEHKQTEGDPMIRARIRSVQKEMARKRMMADVPKADVVITNPTTLAVALVYRQGEMTAPKVVAKGAGFIAERIRETARLHGVPVIENKPVARLLFKTVKIGDPIPSKLYRAVAEILAYIYRLRRT